MNFTRYFKVGLFFIILGTAGTAYIITSTDGFNNFNTKLYEVIMEDATGLTTNSKVYLAGVPVGKIRSIDLSGEQALLQVAFLRNMEIRGDAQLARKSSSILGTSILTLTPGTELTPIVKEGGRIATLPGASDMTAILGTAQGLSEQISGLLKEFQDNQMKLIAVSLETFNSLARKLDERSAAELDRVSRILESSAVITAQVERMLREREGDVESSAIEVRKALENLRAVTDEIRGGKGNVGKAIYGEDLYSTVLSTVEKTEAAAEKLQDALDSVNRLATNADKVVQDAGSIIGQASGLTVQVGTQARYHFLDPSFRAGASLTLEPRSKDRWYRVGVSSVPDGLASRSITETNANGTLTRTETVQTKFGVGIDAELARRFGPLTIRGGLLEGSAGIGLDYQPIKWLELSGEVFDFRTGALPNLRGTLTLYPFFDPKSNKPWNWLFFQGGVSAALDSRRDYFFGAGLRFADEEVRGLVGLVPMSGN